MDRASAAAEIKRRTAGRTTTLSFCGAGFAGRGMAFA
jgi:hypothetical protein